MTQAMPRSADPRRVSRIVRGLPATDGAGVELTRVIGQPALPMLDPFLMLDAFRSDRPDDYIAGFPPHPHRGFETVTYLLNGRMRHRDNAGHEGVIEPGGILELAGAAGVTVYVDTEELAIMVDDLCGVRPEVLPMAAAAEVTVVADEVRSLAERTASSTSQLRLSGSSTSSTLTPWAEWSHSPSTAKTTARVRIWAARRSRSSTTSPEKSAV